MLHGFKDDLEMVLVVTRRDVLQQDTILQRLSTVKNSDVIMVLDHGRIIERGSHDALLEKKGTYYQLYTGNVRPRVAGASPRN